MMGLEPTAFGLADRRSTFELHPQVVMPRSQARNDANFTTPVYLEQALAHANLQERPQEEHDTLDTLQDPQRRRCGGGARSVEG